MATLENKITDDTIVEVFNNGRGSVSAKAENKERFWPAGQLHKPQPSKKIKFREVVEMVNSPGGRVLFERGTLLIKDNKVRAELDLTELSQYILDNDGMIELLENSSIERFEEFLQYCSDAMLEKLVQISIKLPISDMAKATLIKSYTGRDVYILSREYAEENKVEQKPVRKPVEDNEGKETPRRRRIIKE